MRSGPGWLRIDRRFTWQPCEQHGAFVVALGHLSLVAVPALAVGAYLAAPHVVSYLGSLDRNSLLHGMGLAGGLWAFTKILTKL